MEKLTIDINQMLQKFSDGDVQRVWEKGKIVSNYDPIEYRKDACEAWIIRKKYGDRSSKYGWEIDHIIPESQGGSDSLSNLRPLQWENNAKKSDGRLICTVKASGKENTNV